VIKIEVDDLIKKLENKNVMIVFAPKYNISGIGVELANKLSKRGVVFYFSCIKTCKHLLGTFSQIGAKIENIKIIDGITRTITSTPPKSEGCVYLSAPYKFEEMFIAIKELSREKTLDFFVFDALSTVAIYYGYAVSREIGITVKFVNLLQLINDKCKIIFLSSDDSKDDPLIQEVLTLVDEVVES